MDCVTQWKLLKYHYCQTTPGAILQKWSAIQRQRYTRTKPEQLQRRCAARPRYSLGLCEGRGLVGFRGAPGVVIGCALVLRPHLHYGLLGLVLSVRATARREVCDLSPVLPSVDPVPPTNPPPPAVNQRRLRRCAPRDALWGRCRTPSLLR